jgi:hypothetical protein
MSRLKNVGVAVSLAVLAMGAQATTNLATEWYIEGGNATFANGAVAFGSGSDHTGFGHFALTLVGGESYLLSFTSIGPGKGTVDLNMFDLALNGNYLPVQFGQGFQTYNFVTGNSQINSHLEFAWFSGDAITLSGISVTAVPEPESWAMLMVGLAAVGGMARRRKAGQAAA